MPRVSGNGGWRSIIRRVEIVPIVLFLALLLAAGTCGYRWIEGWSWGDSLYMTVITITAVGYHEVHPLSDAGRTLTAFVLAGGITGLGMWFALVTATMVRADISGQHRQRTKRRRLERMNDHVIVCGGGRMGVQVARELAASGQPVVILDLDREARRSLRRIVPGAVTVADNATDDRALVRAGVERARGLVSCLSADADNLYVCLSARHLNPELAIVVRAEGSAAMEKLRRAGADHVVSPNATGAVWVASVLVRPSVASMMGATGSGSRVPRRLDHVTVAAGSEVAGRTLAEADIPGATGLVVIAVRRNERGDDELEFNPGPETRLHPGDDVVVLAAEDKIRKLRSLLS